MAKPFTFHMQIRENIHAQNRAEDFRSFFSRPDVIKALDRSGIIHFARMVLIPNDRILPGTKGTFALQVVLVYDGTLENLLDWFTDVNVFRELFIGLSAIGKIACKDTEDPAELLEYIAENNINRTERELHMGHHLTVKQIREMFPQPSELLTKDGKAPIRKSKLQPVRI